MTFGITAFAQAPFASLGNLSIAVDVDETLTLTELQTGIADFLVARDETLTLTELQAGVVDFLVAANESF
jgi:hypothetical protein